MFLSMEVQTDAVCVGRDEPGLTSPFLVCNCSYLENGVVQKKAWRDTYIIERGLVDLMHLQLLIISYAVQCVVGGRGLGLMRRMF